jgi:nucleotidyltransferase/DNA polymerase involved in DNA repair
VAVVTSFKSMGRVLTVCPLARAEGVAEEMPYPEARARCPEAAFFMPDKELAARALTKLMERAQSFSPLVEPAGGGRILLDTRGTEKLWGSAGNAGELLRADITKRLRLPVAAGVAARRPWSLLASRAAGEDGVYQVEPGTEDAFLGHIPVAWVDGVSAKTRSRLAEMNIRAVGQLRQFERGEIHRQFGGADGEMLWNALHPHPWEVGVSIATPVTSIVEDAVRVEAALAEATVAAEKLRIMTRALAGQAAATLRMRDLGAARLRLTLLHADGMMKTAHVRTGGFVQDEGVLLSLAEGLLAKIFHRRVRVSRIWLSAEKLAEPQRQGVLFPPGSEAELREQTPTLEYRKTERLLGTLDRIHNRYGEGVLRSASMLKRSAS